MSARSVVLHAGEVALEGTLEVPALARAVVVFSHGSGSSRHSPRNGFVAQVLRRAGLGTLLFDLVSAEEDRDPRRRFDIDLLTERLALAVRFVDREATTAGGLAVGLFGASTGAASALRVAAAMPEAIAAVVSRGGRPDLAGPRVLQQVRAPTLLIVGGLDDAVIALNAAARDRLVGCERQLAIVPGATHLFEEPGTLAQAAQQAARWFLAHLPPAARAPRNADA